MTKVTLNDIRTMAKKAKGYIDKIYLHWSAGHYGQFFSDYHLNIDEDGSVYASTNDLTERKAHTWRRNSGAIGISMSCCAFATTNDLGEEPPTFEQIEAMAQVVAVLCQELDIECTSDNVMTHSEAADFDDYGPATTCERWDLLFLSNDTKDVNGGDTIRGKANWYMNEGV